MINLLPDEAKHELKAARTNSLLLKFIFALGLGVAFLGFISGGAYLILMDTQASAERVISSNPQNNDSYTSIQQQTAALRSSLSSAKTVLADEVRYSTLLTTIASLMPEGTIIDKLDLSDAMFDTPTTLTVFAKSTDAALKVKDNFQSNSLFSGVTFEGISSGATTGAGNYGVTATMKLTINRSAAK